MAPKATSESSLPAQAAEHNAFNIIIAPPSTPKSNEPSLLSPSTCTISEQSTPTNTDSPSSFFPVYNSLTSTLLRHEARARHDPNFESLGRALQMLAYVLQQQHERSLEEIKRIRACIEEETHGDWAKTSRKVLGKREEEIRKEVREMKELASAWNMFALAFGRLET